MEVVEGLNNRYVREIIQEEYGKGLEGYRSRIVQKNKIIHFIRIDKRYIDGEGYFYFDITGLQSLKQVLAGETVTVEKMNAFIDALEETLQRMEEYLLLQAELCLQPEYILYDRKHDEWKFMYVPNYKGNQAADIESLVEIIMNRVDCENDDDLERFYDFYSEVLRNAEELSLATLVRLWDKGGFKFPKIIENGGEKVPVLSEKVELVVDTRTVCETKPIYKGRIYEVPYHGVKINGGQDGTLT